MSRNRCASLSRHPVSDIFPRVCGCCDLPGWQLGSHVVCRADQARFGKGTAEEGQLAKTDGAYRPFHPSGAKPRLAHEIHSFILSHTHRRRTLAAMGGYGLSSRDGWGDIGRISSSEVNNSTSLCFMHSFGECRGVDGVSPEFGVAGGEPSM